MRIVYLKIRNFRGIRSADVCFPEHSVLVGDNNTGKTAILEALDLVLGPNRLRYQPPIDEHEFFEGKYRAELPDEKINKINEDQGDESQSVTEIPDNEIVNPYRIEIEVTLAYLSVEQKCRFADYLEFWDSSNHILFCKPISNSIDQEKITEAIRVTFLGWYDAEEDDFEGRTYFSRTFQEGETPREFTRKHKQYCGFLYLRSRRTGARALSLERGSLLDAILRIENVRPQMWEDIICKLTEIHIANEEKFGISPILESIESALLKFVPREWGVGPRLKVSNLTREHLRKVIWAFLATGKGHHAAPFEKQGSGTINMLVLAMLSHLAERHKQEIILVMDELETAIPPYTQKNIIHETRKLAKQTIFTSHSPYVLEEFEISETIMLVRDAYGFLERKSIILPENMKPKYYQQGFRTRFCEGLLAPRILVAEGATEASVFPAVCRHLAKLDPGTYSSLEILGVCAVDAGGETKISGTASLFKNLGKCTMAICDLQNDSAKSLIESQVDLLLMHDEERIEDLVINNTTKLALIRFASTIELPQHIAMKYPNPEANISDVMLDYFNYTKGSMTAITDFLCQCVETEIPLWLRNAAKKTFEFILGYESEIKATTSGDQAVKENNSNGTI